ncbi:MAG: hypothetical protein ACUVSY_01540 [Roseiflexus sp.]
MMATHGNGLSTDGLRERATIDTLPNPEQTAAEPAAFVIALQHRGV